MIRYSAKWNIIIRWFKFKWRVTYQWIESPSELLYLIHWFTTVSPATGTNTYVLIATNGTCIDRDTIVVTSSALPVVDAGPTVSIPIFSSASIGGNPTCATGTTFSWTPVGTLDNPSATNPTSGTTVTTIYTVTVVDGNGCLNSDTVTVFVYPEIKILMVSHLMVMVKMTFGK